MIVLLLIRNDIPTFLYFKYTAILYRKGEVMDIALIDFDGTITDNDNFTSFCFFATSRLRKILILPVLLPVFLMYKCGLIPASRTRIIVSYFAFKGYTIDRISGKGLAYSRERIPVHVRGVALERMAHHKENGDLVVVVSASLNAYLEPWAEANGVRLICTALETINGRLTGRYIGGDCTGGEKVARIRKEFDLGSFDKIYVYGDTSEDREMLSLGDERFYRWKRIDSEKNHSNDRRG